MDLITEAKKKAAIQAVDDHLHNGQKIGIGSGSTVVFAVEHLAKKYKEREITDIVCIPTSFQARNLIIDNNLPLGYLNQYPVLDVDIDGAAEVDNKLNLIKGGGGCHLQEKLVAACAEKLVIIADYRKDSEILGTQWKNGVPLEVSPLAYKAVMLAIEKYLGKPRLRMAKNKAGPVVSDNGNFIIDADFGEINAPEALNAKLLLIPGILETGLFINMAQVAYFGQEDGTVIKRTKVEKE